MQCSRMPEVQSQLPGLGRTRCTLRRLFFRAQPCVHNVRAVVDGLAMLGASSNAIALFTTGWKLTTTYLTGAHEVHAAQVVLRAQLGVHNMLAATVGLERTTPMEMLITAQEQTPSRVLGFQSYRVLL